MKSFIRATKSGEAFDLDGFNTHNPATNPMFADLHAAGMGADDFRITAVTVTFLELGNAFAIHNWAVQNLMGGHQFDHGTFTIPYPDMFDLKEICQKVLLVPGLASTLLPNPGDVYDDHYVNCAAATARACTNTESLPHTTWAFEYQFHD